MLITVNCIWNSGDSRQLNETVGYKNEKGNIANIFIVWLYQLLWKAKVRTGKIASQRTYNMNRALLFFYLRSYLRSQRKGIDTMLTADNLNIVREFHGLNQRQLADLIGVGRSYVTMIESGQRPLTDDLQARTVKALQLTPDKLVAIVGAARAYSDAKQTLLN